MSAGLIDKLRFGRRSPVVLKTALSNIRARNASAVVFVFEGLEDVGVYEVWAERCGSAPDFEPLPASGKDQVLEFREMLKADTTGLNHCVFFFVDLDFDGLKGRAPGDDLFAVDSYSVENNLVDERALDSLMRDEFRCATDTKSREDVRQLFSVIRGEFHSNIEPLMLRLFAARRLGIRVTNMDDSICSLVRVQLTGVTLKPGADVAKFLRLEREPTDAELDALREEFSRLTPAAHYRGKFEVQMFFKWLQLLREDRMSDHPTIFSEQQRALGNIQAALTLRSLAGRNKLPDGFCDFLRAAAQGCC